MGTVSVIIPVYNAAAYIQRCLGSLQKQTFEDWEAICVDDGSNDGSAELLDSLADADRRIKVLHIKNAGVAAARNEALDYILKEHNDGTTASHPEFLMFVDSDDFLHPEAMEICLRQARDNAADLVAFTYDRRYRTRQTVRQALHIRTEAKPGIRHYKMPERVLVTEDIFAYATEWSKPRDIAPSWAAVKHCQPWRCFYRFERIEDLRFPEGIIYEDFPWWSAVLLRVRKAVIINLPFYFYYPNFKGFIHSAAQQYRIESLRKAIGIAENCYDGAPDEQKERWKKNFLEPFKNKLKKKEDKYSNK